MPAIFDVRKTEKDFDGGEKQQSQAGRCFPDEMRNACRIALVGTYKGDRLTAWRGSVASRPRNMV